MQPAEIDEDWCPAWPVDRQRSYAGVEPLVSLGAEVADIVPV
ncbi:hypothetical protein [Streptomyces sp. SP2-10]|nr:hypothetical protein [Streptomyces sp. SP2-10]